MKESEGSGLFTGQKEGGEYGSAPLADRMRPRHLDEFVGQDHIIGPGRLLRRAIQKDQLSSIIFSGPPGTGKTTLARIIANTTSRRFVTLNAVLAGVADIRVSLEDARRQREFYDRRTILFVDEVHRWNKSQQDALLPWVENGTVILIGATTENPFFEVNRALVSRSRIFLLRPLEKPDLEKAARLALSDRERGYGKWKVSFQEGAFEHLVEMADGDARNLLNALELAVETSVPSWPPETGSPIMISLDSAEESIQRRAVLYDKDGDFHYDAASAFIKSIRGSDPDAALYWLARMVYAGEDPRFMFRRMLISASEDVGLADPDAIALVESCARAFERIGMPEGQFHLAQAALYLATCPKSNSTLGFFDALKAVESEAAEVPNHLKDASRDAVGFGHGDGYAYPHAYRDHWVAQQYLPDSMKERVFYNPGDLGAEGQRKAVIMERRESQLASILLVPAIEMKKRVRDSHDDGKTVWSRSGERLEEWRTRSEADAGERLSIFRTALFDACTPEKTDRILIFDARDGYLAWEARRRCPEGTVVALVRSEAEARLMEERAQGLGVLEKPVVIVFDPESASPGGIGSALLKQAGFSSIDLVVTSDMGLSFASPSSVLQSLASSLQGARFASVEQSYCESSRLSAIMTKYADTGAGTGFHSGILERFALFEAGFFASPEARKFPRSARDIRADYSDSSLPEMNVREVEFTYPRVFTMRDSANWFGTGSVYGSALRNFLGEKEAREVAALFLSIRKPVAWPCSAVLVTGKIRESLPASP